MLSGTGKLDSATANQGVQAEPLIPMAYVAAEKTGRRARLIEFDPVNCDQIIQRFEKLTGKQARLAITGESFEDIAEERRADTLQIKKEEVQ